MIEQMYQVLLNGIIFGLVAAVVAALMAPLQFLKIIRQQTGGGYLYIFKDTVGKSGFLTLFRGAVPYASMNFLSSMAFGISEYISQSIIAALGISLFFAVIFRAFMGSAIETLFSLYSELQEIAKNKGSLMQSDAKIISVLMPILLRNAVFWHGSVITYEVSNSFSLGILTSSILAFFLGALFAVASIPLDVIATQNCGAKSNKGLVARFNEVLNESGASSVFAGTSIRIMQIGIFTIATVMTMFVLN